MAVDALSVVYNVQLLIFFDFEDELEIETNPTPQKKYKDKQKRYHAFPDEIYYFVNYIFIKPVLHSKINAVIENTFLENEEYAQVEYKNLQNTIEIIKNYAIPNIANALFIENDQLYEQM